MAKLRSVNTRFWTDSFIVELDPVEKLLFLYLITNPFTTLAGCYEIQVRQIAFDTGIDKDTVLRLCKRFEEAGKLVYCDGWIVLPNFLKNQSLNANMKKCVSAELERVPDWASRIVTKSIENTAALRNDSESFGIVRPPYPILQKEEDEVEDEVERKGGVPPPVREIAFGEIITGVKANLGVKRLSPSQEREWLNQAEICLDNGFTGGQFLECLALLRQQKWRTGRTTPANVTANLPELKKLRTEIEKQNGAGKRKKWDTEVPSH